MRSQHKLVQQTLQILVQLELLLASLLLLLQGANLGIHDFEQLVLLTSLLVLVPSLLNQLVRYRRLSQMLLLE